MIVKLDEARGESKPGAAALLGDAWRLVRARQGPFLAALLLVNVAFAGAMLWVGPRDEGALKAPLAHWSYEALTAAVTALLTALALRLFLAPESRWWRLDRSLARGVAALTLASLAATAAGELGEYMHSGPAGALHGLALQIPVWGVCATLMLWPVGLLIEDGEMSPNRSVLLMRGNVRAYVVACLLLFGGLALAMVVVAIPGMILHIKPANMSRELWLPTGLVFGAFAIAQTALWAALYQSRTAVRAAGPLNLSARAAE